jgi:hypothetical protein
MVLVSVLSLEWQWVVVQVVEALHHKIEDTGFDYWWDAQKY